MGLPSFDIIAQGLTLLLDPDHLMWLALGMVAGLLVGGIPGFNDTNFLAMMLVGALLFGPDSLVSGAVSQDIGGPHAAALACGIINGLGSIGAIFQGFMTDYVSRTYGWDMLFIIFQFLAILATLSLLPFFRVRPEEEPT